MPPWISVLPPSTWVFVSPLLPLCVACSGCWSKWSPHRARGSSHHYSVSWRWTPLNSVGNLSGPPPSKRGCLTNGCCPVVVAPSLHLLLGTSSLLSLFSWLLTSASTVMGFSLKSDSLEHSGESSTLPRCDAPRSVDRQMWGEIWFVGRTYTKLSRKIGLLTDA